MRLPKRLKNIARYEAGRTWLEELPQRIEEISQRWDLRVGNAYDGSSVSYVAPVVCEFGEAVLKIQWPHEECRFEADALECWDGDGTIRLLKRDAANNAMLLERCTPGLPLSETGDIDPMTVLTGLLPRLWKPAGKPFKPLAREAADWLAVLHQDWENANRPCEEELIDETARYLETLPGTQGEQILVHQDLHGENVLSAGREPWLVIDPKPLAGERDFAVASIIRSFEFGHSRTAVLGRMQRLTDELSLDRDRVIGWTVAQTMAWSFDSSHCERHFETVRWLLEG